MEGSRAVFVFLAIVFASCQLSAAYSYSVTLKDFEDSIINGSCIQYIDSSSYLAIENSLLNRTQNLVNLRQAFFPTNRQASISVNIKYSFVNSSETVTYRWLQSSVLMLIRSDLLRHLSLFMYSVKTRHTEIILDPICNFSNDDNIPPKIVPGPGDYCKHSNSIGHHLLNNLTANLLSYALHRKSVADNGIDLADDSGYSVYVVDTDNPSDYCVFDEVHSFYVMRVLFFTSFVILEATSVFSIPLLLASVYETFKKKMLKGNMRYFVWASFILIVLLIPLLLTCNIFAIVDILQQQSSTHFHEIFAAGIMMSVILPVLFVIDVVAAILVTRRLKGIAGSYTKVNCFGLYKKLTGYEDIDLEENDDNNEPWWEKVKIILHGVVIVAVTFFTQLMLFNFIFVIVGAVAAPVETGSLLMLYIASFFSLISFFAVILKVFHNIVIKKTEQSLLSRNEPIRVENQEIRQNLFPRNEPIREEYQGIRRNEDPFPVQIEEIRRENEKIGAENVIIGAENERRADENENNPVQQDLSEYIIIFSWERISKMQYFLCFISLILLVFILAAGIGVTVSFIYIYTVLNQEYRNNRGIITFLGALLPSLLASTSGFFWTRVLPCIGKQTPQRNPQQAAVLAQNA